jgi:anti-anti-sigma factor
MLVVLFDSSDIYLCYLSSLLGFTALNHTDGILLKLNISQWQSQGKYMNFFAEFDESIVVLTPKQRLDHADTEKFQRTLAPYLRQCNAKGPAILLDMSGVPYVSSIGLRILMLAAKQVKSQGGHLVISGLQPAVKEVFEISGFDHLFRLFCSRARALAQLEAEMVGVTA